MRHDRVEIMHAIAVFALAALMSQFMRGRNMLSSCLTTVHFAAVRSGTDIVVLTAMKALGQTRELFGMCTDASL